MTAFDLGLKAQIETAQSDEQREYLEGIQTQLLTRAEDLRKNAIKAAGLAVANRR